MSDIYLVDAATVTDVVSQILVEHGVRPGDAKRQAAIWVEADLRGQPSHGVQRLFTMLGRITNGRVNLDGEPTIKQVAPAVLVADGGNGLGPAVAFSVLELLDDCAHANGIALALVRRSHHLGMLAPYVEWLADRDLVGIAACTSEALVHPWGGSQALVGTNPLAIGIPIAGQGPMSLDMSTGAISRGRVLHHSLTGRPLEPGWAVDAAGRPTTDPQDALEGAISPFGGAKGYALGIALEVLVAGLTGTAFGQDVTGTLDETEPVTKGDLFIAIDPGSAGASTMAQLAAGYLEDVRSSPLAAGFEAIVVPGDRARAARQHRLAEGVELDARLWQRILDARSPGEDVR